MSRPGSTRTRRDALGQTDDEHRVRHGFGGYPTLATREVLTTVRLRDGETNIIAGLIKDTERTVANGIPGFDKIPLLGRLFARNKRETQETDLVLTLTPHIVRVLALSDEDLRPFRFARTAAAFSLSS